MGLSVCYLSLTHLLQGDAAGHGPFCMLPVPYTPPPRRRSWTWAFLYATCPLHTSSKETQLDMGLSVCYLSLTHLLQGDAAGHGPFCMLPVPYTPPPRRRSWTWAFLYATCPLHTSSKETQLDMGLSVCYLSLTHLLQGDAAGHGPFCMLPVPYTPPPRRRSWTWAFLYATCPLHTSSKETQLDMGLSVCYLSLTHLLQGDAAGHAPICMLPVPYTPPPRRRSWTWAFLYATCPLHTSKETQLDMG